MKSTIEKLPKSEVKIMISVPSDDFEKYHGEALTKIQEAIEIDGFRKGHAPEDQITKKFGEMIILEEMANLSLKDAYMKVLDEHKLFPIVEPHVTITKLAKGNPFEATILISVLPEVTLPDYNKVSKETVKEENFEVEAKEVDDVLLELHKGKSKDHHHDHSHDHGDHDHAHDHEHDHPESPALTDTKEVEAPVLDDTFAQSFGEQFKTLDDLKTKVKENLLLEKKQKASDKRRSAIMEALLKDVKVEVGDALIENELNRMVAQMRSDVGRFGGTWEDYLKHASKTEAELRSDWRKDAERRVTTQLILSEISKKEKLIPSEEEIDVELVRLKAMMPEADETRARDYLFQALSNEKTLAYLEGVQK